MNDPLTSIVLHPYFKLAYIEIAWGGAAEQEAERKAGDPFAKNWQDEARKILEGVVCARPLVDINISNLHLHYRWNVTTGASKL